MFKKIDTEFNSKIITSSLLSEDGRILIVKFKGEHRIGSEGNPDSLYMFSELLKLYFIFEPLLVIVDLSELNYKWGNTILKITNFFNEIGRDTDEKNKLVIIVYSVQNKEPLIQLNSLLQEGRREFCENITKAESLAKIYVEKYDNI